MPTIRSLLGVTLIANFLFAIQLEKLSPTLIEKLYTPYDSCVLLNGLHHKKCLNIQKNSCDVLSSQAVVSIPNTLYYALSLHGEKQVYLPLKDQLRKLANSSKTLLLIGDSIMKDNLAGLFCLLKRENSHFTKGSSNPNISKHVVTYPIVLNSSDPFSLPLLGYLGWGRIKVNWDNSVPILKYPKQYVVLVNSGLHEGSYFGDRLARVFRYWTNRSDVYSVFYTETSLQHYAQDTRSGKRKYCGYFPDIRPYSIRDYPYFECVPHNMSDCPVDMDYRLQSEHDALQDADRKYHNGQYRIPVHRIRFRDFSGIYYDMHRNSPSFHYTDYHSKADCTHYTGAIPVLNYLHWMQLLYEITL
jgi:hypothetical protein